MAFFPQLTCYPPLNQLTILSASQNPIEFTVVLETSATVPPFPWEVVLCYKGVSSSQMSIDWCEVALEKAKQPPMILDALNREAEKLNFRQLIFKGLLSLNEEENTVLGYSFTLKYRIDPLYAWYWIKHNNGVCNGTIIFQRLALEVKLSSLVEIDNSWEITSVNNSTSGTTTFRLMSPKLAAVGGPISSMTKIVGSIIKQQRFLALVNMPECWLFPRHGKEKFYIPEDAIMCCFLTQTGHCITLLGLSGFDNVQVSFQSTPDHQIAAKIRNDGTKVARAQIVVSVAANLDIAIHGAITTARDILEESKLDILKGTDCTAQRYAWKDTDSTTRALKNWYDGLSFCTWNSIGPNLNVEKILASLNSLKDNDINVSNLIIDDNWQDIGDDEFDMTDESARPRQGWNDFEASKTAFPDGLKSGVAKIKDQHPYLENVAVWHAMFGYWGAISEDGRLSKKYKTIKEEALLLIGHVTKEMTVIDPCDIHQFFDDFYSFLASCHITSVKTDVQHMMGEFSSAVARVAILGSYPSAWRAAYEKHFQGRAISCMSMISQNLLLSHLPVDRPKVLLRNSDDFFPEIASSHTRHIFTNAHNALFTRQLNVLPDWDMFQTDHIYSAYHAAARCISGGPVYITDAAGHHNVELIRMMTARSPQGKTIALRPSTLARALSPWNDFHDGHVLRIGSAVETGSSNTGILGIFNIAEKQTSCIISLADFAACSSADEDLDKRDQILVRSFLHEQLFPPKSKVSTSADSVIYTTLPTRGFDILFAHPIHEVTLESKSIPFTCLGLLHKMSGPAAITNFFIDHNEDGSIVHIQLKGLGILGIWYECEDEFAFISNTAYFLQGREISKDSKYITIRERSKRNKSYGDVIEIDLLRFWDDKKLEDRGKEEADLAVYITRHI